MSGGHLVPFWLISKTAHFTVDTPLKRESHRVIFIRWYLQTGRSFPAAEGTRRCSILNYGIPVVLKKLLLSQSYMAYPATRDVPVSRPRVIST